MDLLTLLETALHHVDSASRGFNLLGRLNRLVFGRLVITSPSSGERRNTEWVLVKGSHSRVDNGRFYYWLMTINGNEWWPQHEIRLLLDGTWSGKVNVGKTTGPRTSIAAVVRVTPVVNVLLNEWKKLKNSTGNIDPIILSRRNLVGWTVVESVSIPIPEGAILIGQQS